MWGRGRAQLQGRQARVLEVGRVLKGGSSGRFPKLCKSTRGWAGSCSAANQNSGFDCRSRSNTMPRPWPNAPSWRAGKQARAGVARNLQLPFVPPEDWHEPTARKNRYRVVVQPPGKGFRHILTPNDVRERLEPVSPGSPGQPASRAVQPHDPQKGQLSLLWNAVGLQLVPVPNRREPDRVLPLPADAQPGQRGPDVWRHLVAGSA